MSIDYSKYIERAATSFDKPQESTKTSYEAPAEGPCGLRFVGYIETGAHDDEYQGQKKVVNKVKLIFEVRGPKYPTREIGGEQVPVRITVSENLSMFAKANFKRLFDVMKGQDESIKHPAQLLGRAYAGRIYQKKTSQGRTIAVLQHPQTKVYSIGPAVVEDPESGEIRQLNVPTPVSPIRCFIFDQADKEMWDSIFVPGSYGEGRSRNIFQEEIRTANNWQKVAAAIGEGVKGSAELDAFFSSPALTPAPLSEEDPFSEKDVHAAATARPGQPQTADQAARNRFARRS